MNSPNHLPSPVPVSPTNQPPSPMEDRSPPHAPKMVRPSPSANEPTEPPSKIPNNHKDLDNVAVKLVNLVPDQPLPLPSFESTKVSEPISTNVHLDTPITDEDTLSIDPVKKEDVEAVAYDYVKNPIYLRLESFLQRTFHDTSAKSQSVGYADSDVNPQHSLSNENIPPQSFEEDSTSTTSTTTPDKPQIFYE